ncbi:MAG TPA: hypothetical protein VGH28_27690 [Polyangiaceae bacterium]|jgi:hypothetical protein
MRILWVGLVATAACGGAAAPAVTVHHEDVAVTTSPVASSAPLFTGAFEVESMTDGKQTAVVADLIHKLKGHDGRMTWEIGADKFKIGMWTMSEPEKINASDADDATKFAEFCAAAGEVSAHWEGPVLVLGSTIAASGSGGLVRIHEKHARGETTRQQATQISHCSASFAATRITFRIVEKDDAGPTVLQADAPGVTLTLRRGQPIGDVDASKVFGH